jgi:two-component system phosphate regulon sensor histidine kinase PhoR
MTKFGRIARTSLFARMSLLFGLLVTVPLVISGILLSLGGWSIVNDSGSQVAKKGDEAVEKMTGEFNTIAKNALDDATKSLTDISRHKLEDTRRDTVAAARRKFGDHTAKLRQEGERAVKSATESMLSVATGEISASLERVSKGSHASLDRMGGVFTSEMQQELRAQSEPIRKSTSDVVFSSWNVSASRRTGAIIEHARDKVFQLVQRLQLPIQRSDIILGDENEAPKTLRVYVNGGAHEVLRSMLVNPAGLEEARYPDEGITDPVDWTKPDSQENRTREALLKSDKSYIAEPIRKDPKTGKWIIRIAHKIVRETGTETPPPPAPDDAGAAQAMMEKPPMRFLVVDYSLETLVQDAVSDPPDKMQLLLIEAADGTVISARDVRSINGGARGILEKLPKGTDAIKYQDKLFTFHYNTAEGVPMLGAARYWDENKAWSVVAQPEEDVLAPVSGLEEGINQAWMDSLGKVKGRAGKIIGEIEAKGRAANGEALKQSRTHLAQREATLVGQLKQSLDTDQNRMMKELAADLQTTVNQQNEQLKKAPVDPQVSATTQKALNKLASDAAGAQSSASADIQGQARHIANWAAARSLVNSALLIPLFLLLALFLAMLTASSLVKPINQLVQGTQAVAAGNYSERIKIKGDDELARLAGAFNNMSAAIETGQAELQQSHDSLAAEKARIEGIVESSPDGLVMLEPSGLVAFMNPAAIELLGLKREQLPPDPFAVSALPALAADRLQQILDKVADSEGIQEYEVQEPERSVVQLRRVNLKSVTGRSYGQLLHLHDITQERVIDEMKSDFISLVSHELRTPLTSILGFSSYMLTGRMGEVADTQKTALESIHRQAKRLSAIISDFLDVSRIESGKIEMRKDTVPIDMVAGRVIEDLRPQAAEKQIHVSAQSHEGPYPLVALGDEQRIAQVFTNLVGNALKFTDPDGSVDIHVSRNNGELLCKVVDTGCGIPPDELDRVFDRFYQVEKVVTRKTGGTGLGLAIVKNIVEAHGGRIWIESQLGKGTEVTFTLPGAS